jgi:hypothetical protein
MEQLLDKLVKSKAIMDRHNNMSRNETRQQLPMESVESFSMPAATYNIPQEYLQESPMSSPSNVPVVNTKPVGVPTIDAIKKSKLPDDIKQLMIEHPIHQPQQYSPTLSDDVIERAARLMKEGSNNYVPESAKPQTKSQPSPSSSIDYSIIKKMIEEAVESSLKKNGIIAESSERANEVFSFKVGKHVFEGKVTKIKKIN